MSYPSKLTQLLPYGAVVHRQHHGDLCHRSGGRRVGLGSVIWNPTQTHEGFRERACVSKWFDTATKSTKTDQGQCRGPKPDLYDYLLYCRHFLYNMCTVEITQGCDGCAETRQESCAIAKMTTRCADKSKQTATPPPKIMWLSVDSIQPDVMDVGLERIFSPPKFLHVPLEVGGWPLGYEERRRWTNCSCNQFPRFSTYVVMIHQRHRRTDRQTDRRHAIARPHFAL